MSISDFLSGARILAVVDSPVNGELTVVRDLAWGTYIQGGGITQSSGVMDKVWNKAIAHLKKTKPEAKRILVLGIGGGGIIKLIRKYWQDSKIKGVDNDSVIVDLGKRFLGLGEIEMEEVIADAYEFSKGEAKSGQKYDIVFVDLYVGSEVPQKFSTSTFIKMVKKLLNNDGVAVFNRVYYGEKRQMAHRFREQLAKVFSGVEVLYPTANVIYICSN